MNLQQLGLWFTLQQPYILDGQFFSLFLQLKYMRVPVSTIATLIKFPKLNGEKYKARLDESYGCN
uniref:Uncharacterized protein n=1 Tax=Rhizophora mucronata TaxID=61149 RepID=A0A2P2PW17_RHIMU